MKDASVHGTEIGHGGSWIHPHVEIRKIQQTREASFFTVELS